MPPHDRRAGALRCSEVLERLSAFVDGELSAEDVAAIREHLVGCDWCERFGTGFAGVLRGLKTGLRVEGAVPAEVAARLDARIHRN